MNEGDHKLRRNIKQSQGIKMAWSCYYSDGSENTSVTKKADIGEETQMKSGLNKSGCYGDYKSLTFIIFEHLEIDGTYPVISFKGRKKLTRRF